MSAIGTGSIYGFVLGSGIPGAKTTSPTMSTVTIRDVAKRAGVGVGTVSRVLNGSPFVSESTRQKVLLAIEKLNYAPSPIARRLSLGRTSTVAVIAPFFTRPSVVERLRGIEFALAQTEYDLVLHNVETVTRRDACFREVPRRERVDGLLLISLLPDDEEAQRLVKSNVPVVLVDAPHPAPLNQVVIDDVSGGYQATRHLIDLGHRKIGYISDYLENPFDFVSSRYRYEGYLMALEEADIPFRPEYHQQGNHGRDVARTLARHLLTLPDPPTAIFAASDTQAIGVLETAREMDIDVPDQLSVIGFDDIEIAEYLQLTTINQPLFASGVEGVELLKTALENPLAEPQRLTLPTDLIVRTTTGSPQTRQN
jgi:DNA-binding LacI/PurR family transcriptional regulator